MICEGAERKRLRRPSPIKPRAKSAPVPGSGITVAPVTLMLAKTTRSSLSPKVAPSRALRVTAEIEIIGDRPKTAVIVGTE